jgi:hypothetical protein
MQLDRYVDNLTEQLAVAAEAGGEEARALASRLAAPLQSAIRLTLLDVLDAAAAEITRELAPASVELRLRGGQPEFAVSAPSAGPAASGAEPAVELIETASGSGEGGVARINLRLPEQLKVRVEQAAERQGLSVNSWLVRAAAAAVERGAGATRGEHTARGGQHYTGWGR